MATSEKARNFSCAQKRTRCLWSLQWCFLGWSNLSHTSSNRNSKNLRCYCFGVSWSGRSAVLFFVMAALVLPGPLGALIFLVSRLRQTSSIFLGSGGGHLFSSKILLYAPFIHRSVVYFFVQVVLTKLQPDFFFLFTKQMHRKRASSKEFVWKGRLKDPQRGETPRICTYFVYV